MRAVSGHPGEELLYGGITNAGLVSRIGDTVRRPQRPTSPATHALLGHLERVGFEGAPRLLGVDDRSREVRSFVPGEAAIAPYAAWALSDEALVSVAQLLRRYHDAGLVRRHQSRLAAVGAGGVPGQPHLPQRP